MRRIVENLLNAVCFGESISVLVKYLSSSSPAGVDFLIVTNGQDLERVEADRKYDLVLCVSPLNDYVGINEFLRKIHSKLKPGGLLVGRTETLETRKMHILRHRSRAVYGIIFLYDFIVHRALPGLLGSIGFGRKIGIVRHRIMSKCEALGRLRFCGYEILSVRESVGHLCFVTSAGVAPANGDPCEGILIKIQKQGLRGRQFYCYKLRTMHPYANYLHDYILDNLQIDNNGKVIGDYRVPVWGKVFRKLWLDELPQLLNILKGELTFIGLRHLSKEFLELYPESWRKERANLRPGFVPPYYADCPKTFEGIIESEKRYSRLRKRHPLTADVYYFVRVVINFLTMRARTG
jgi:hypothetical protein